MALQVEEIIIKNPSHMLDLSELTKKLPNLVKIEVLNVHNHVTAFDGVGAVKEIVFESPFKKFTDDSNILTYPTFCTDEISLDSFSVKGNGNIIGKITTNVFKQSVLDNVQTASVGAVHTNFIPLPDRDKVIVLDIFDTFVAYASWRNFNRHGTPSNSFFNHAITNVEIRGLVNAHYNIR